MRGYSSTWQWRKGLRPDGGGALTTGYSTAQSHRIPIATADASALLPRPPEPRRRAGPRFLGSKFTIPPDHTTLQSKCGPHGLAWPLHHVEATRTIGTIAVFCRPNSTNPHASRASMPALYLVLSWMLQPRAHYTPRPPRYVADLEASRLLTTPHEVRILHTTALNITMAPQSPLVLHQCGSLAPWVNSSAGLQLQRTTPWE